MTHTATVPVLIEVNSNGGFDPFATPECEPLKEFFPADHNNEIVLHLQASLSLHLGMHTASVCLYTMQHKSCAAD